MTDKDLRRLRRDELLEMLIAQSKRMEQMQEELDAARAALASREILLQEAGSIAEASLRINGVFEAAQAAARQYLENVRRISGLPPESEDALPERAEEASASPENEAQDRQAEAPEQEPAPPQEEQQRPPRKGEASLRINGVLEAAQAAAQQCLESVRRVSGLRSESEDALPERAEEAPASPENEAQDRQAEVPEKEPAPPQEKKQQRPPRKKGRKARR